MVGASSSQPSSSPPSLCLSPPPSVQSSEPPQPPPSPTPSAPCQGASETGNVSHPSAHGTPTDLRNGRSRGRIPAECLEQKMLYVYTTVCTQGDFTLSRK